jgi:hypothetical protein
MKFPGFSLTTKGQALLAKVQAGATLSFTRAATGSGKMPPSGAPFGAVSDLETVTVQNTELGTASAADVDTGFTITEETAGDSTTAEVTSVTCLPAADLSGGEYFTIDSPHLGFYVWFSVDAAGTDPKAGTIGIEVALAGADSALTVAQKLATALDQYRVDQSDLYKLVGEEQTLAVQSVTRVDDVVTEIATVLTNTGLETGYYLCELGIFATDPDDGEVLYAYSNAGDNGDYFPAEGGATLVEADLRLRTIVSANASVQMEVSTDAFASLKALMDDVYGRSSKEPVRAASVAPVTLSGLQTVDGVALAANDRVLVKNQSDSSENGIYLVAADAWERTLDFDAAEKISNGLTVPVAEGEQQRSTVWQLSTSGEITLGTTALVFKLVGDRLADTSTQTVYQMSIEDGIFTLTEQ